MWYIDEIIEVIFTHPQNIEILNIAYKPLKISTPLKFKIRFSPNF